MAKDDSIVTTMRFVPQHEVVQKSTRTKTKQAPKASLGKRIKTTAKVTTSGKKKLHAQGLETLSEIALTETEQMKNVTKRSKIDFHSSHTSGSDDEEVRLSKDDEDDAKNDDNEQTESDNDGDDFVYPKFSTPDEEERQDEEDKDKEDNVDEEKLDEEEDVNELYRDVNVNLEGIDTEMTDTLLPNVQVTQVVEDTNVIKTKSAKPPTLDHDWNKTLLAAHGPIQPWISNLARKENIRDSFNELMDTHLDFSTFVMNQLKVDTLTPELLVSPTFELMKGLCKILVEL
nr:hypothetical protein [Tanacetum cinerariifolium]